MGAKILLVLGPSANTNIPPNSSEVVGAYKHNHVH